MMLLIGHDFPPDIRVEKEARALLAAGHEITLVCENRKRRLGREKLNGVKIIRLPVMPIWRHYLNEFTLGMFFHSPFLMRTIKKLVQVEEPDVLHVHDLPYVNTILKTAKTDGLRVIADLHENMPAFFKIRWMGLNRLRRIRYSIFHNYYLWRRYEKRVLPHCDRVIVVVPEAAKRLGNCGVDKEKIVIVSNTEDETTFDLNNPDPTILERYKGHWVVSYIGSTGPHRGLDTAIQAVPIASKRIPNFRMVIVGAKDESQFSSLMRQIHQLGVDECVEVIRWQPFNKVSSYIFSGAVCLVPHNDSEHTQTTVPHKLFQYMIAGKPVVVSSVGPLKRIVEETQCGLVFEANNPTSLAQALMKLYCTPNLGERLGCNGQRAAGGIYAWRNDARRLVELYQKLEEN